MSLDQWRSLNYSFQDIIVLEMILVTLYLVYKRNTILTKNKSIYYYLCVSSVFELTSKVFLKLNSESNYFLFNNYFFIIFETVLLYLYLNNNFKTSKSLKIILVVNFIFILFFTVFIIIFKSNQEYKSLLPSFLHICVLLYFINLVVRKNINRNLGKTSEFLIGMSFLVSYVVLVLFFFYLPPIIEYSRLLANQLIFIKYFISFGFYLIIGYAISPIYSSK
jgi:hypothetical protein